MTKHTKAATGSIFHCPRHDGPGIKAEGRAMCTDCRHKYSVAQGRRWRRDNHTRPVGRPRRHEPRVMLDAAAGWSETGANDWLRRPLKGVGA